MIIMSDNLPCKTSVAVSAEFPIPLEHETVAPERSVGVLVDIVEVSGDLDVRLKWYSTSVPRLSANKICPIGSVEW
jgi:hypothetical protein